MRTNALLYAARTLTGRRLASSLESQTFNAPEISVELSLSSPRMAGPLSNIRTAYSVLESRVNLALRTQVGDTERLRLQRDEALRLLQAATQASFAV